MKAALALLLGLAVASPASAGTALRYGQIPSTARSISSLHLFIAERQGFFSRQGVAVELVPIAGGTDKMVAAIDAGGVDLAQSATPYLIQAVLKGSNAVAIAGEEGNPIYSLMVKPEIADFAGLKGRVLGLSLPADTISISMRKLLTLHGLEPRDYQVEELVGTPVRFECLKKGECDAVPLAQPEDFAAIGQGYRRLGLSTEAVGRFQFQVTLARRDWAAAHRAAVVAFLRGLAASFRFLHDPANRETLVRIIVEHTDASEAIARATLALYFEPDRGVFPRQGEIDRDGLAQVIAFMGEGGSIAAPLPPPERFVDLSYLTAAGVK